MSLSGVKLSARPLEVDNGNYLQQEIWGLLCDELCSEEAMVIAMSNEYDDWPVQQIKQLTC